MLSVFAVTASESRSFFFFFNDTATTEIYTLSLHDALPIFRNFMGAVIDKKAFTKISAYLDEAKKNARSEEHTSELQSQSNLVCRLLLEKKKKKIHPQLVFRITRALVTMYIRSCAHTF